MWAQLAPQTSSGTPHYAMRCYCIGDCCMFHVRSDQVLRAFPLEQSELFDLTPDVIGGIARFKPIRLDLLVRDAVCAAQARAENASTLDPTTESAAIDTDIRQIKVLLKQATRAIPKARSDGDLTQETTDSLVDLLMQSTAHLIPARLAQAGTGLSTACAMFE